MLFRSFNEIHHSIINAINELDNYKPKVHLVDNIENSIIIIDPTLKDNRKQPVIIETIFDPIGSGYLGKAVYCIRMKTPLAAITKYKIFKQKFYIDNDIQKSYGPGIKLCMDISQTGGSLWGIYMSVELPLFLDELKKNPLSKLEVKTAFSQLIESADLTEKLIFNNQDVKIETLNLPIKENKDLKVFQLRDSEETIYTPNWKKDGLNYILDSVDWRIVSDMEKKSMTDNHSNLYIKSFYKKSKWMIQTAYLAKDAQKSEIEILEKHNQVFINNLGWF